MPSVTIDGSSYEAEAGERLIDVINRCGKEIPQVCYHPQLGPIQTCDTCIVEVDGKLTRACGTTISSAITVLTKSAATGRRNVFLITFLLQALLFFIMPSQREFAI